MYRWLRLAWVVAFSAAAGVAAWLRGGREPGAWSLSQELVYRGMQGIVGEVHGDLGFTRVLAGVPPPAGLIGRRMQLFSTRVAGLEAEVLAPPGPSRGTLLYLHGGGYAVCQPATHRDLTARLAAATGCIVVAIDYRKAPEHPFPAARDDAVAAVQALRRAGVDRLWLGGDSAGGALAATTLLALRDGAAPLPEGVVLLSPWVDLSPAGHAPHLDGARDYISPSVLAHYAELYLGGRDPEDPAVSPLFADLSGLPPVLVLLGGAETMRDQGERFVARARAAGSPVELEVAPGMVHVYPAFSLVCRQGRAGLRRIAAFVQGTQDGRVR